MSSPHMYPAPSLIVGPRPESHFESAQQANDIYDLYGRESVYSTTSSIWDGDSNSANNTNGPLVQRPPGTASGEQAPTATPTSGSGQGYPRRTPTVQPSPLRNDGLNDEHEELEELDTPTSLPYANDVGVQGLDFTRPPSRGPDFTRPYSEYRLTQVSQEQEQTRETRWNGPAASEHDDDATSESDYDSLSQTSSSMGGLAGVAAITLPPSSPYNLTLPSGMAGVASSHQTKARAIGLSPIALAGSTFAVTPSEPPTPTQARRSDPQTPISAVPSHLREDNSGTPDQRQDSLSPTSSSNSTPIHPSIARIYSTQRMSGGSDGKGGLSGANSNISLVSSQYPGEDHDAYHVRSTYARLDIEGVFGDGWDEGVERTRGGASNSGARKTMVFPSKDGGMTEQERKFISSLDRYGFVDEPTRSRSEGRLALIPSAPLGKVPKFRMRSSLGAAQPPPPAPQVTRPSAPPPPTPQVPPETRSTPTPKMRKKEDERVVKWMKMMSVAKRDEGKNIVSWRWSSNGEGAKHPTRIYKGIPDRWRMAAWWTLAEVKAGAAHAQSCDTIEATYTTRRDAPSESDVQIDLDVPRTISGHFLFRTRFGHGQRALFHVLHAFSQACETCGYCQGMGSIAATLLCYFEPERAYTLMVRLHDLYDMHGIFAPGFPGLLETFYVQERLLECLIPDVYASFQRNMISSSAWGAKIYITLFTNVVPFHVQLRLWDALWLDGFDVMVAAVLALLWAFRPLLAAPGATFESVLSLLSSYFVPDDDGDALLRWIRRLLGTAGVRDAMAGWRREWRRLIAEGKNDGVLL